MRCGHATSISRERELSYTTVLVAICAGLGIFGSRYGLDTRSFEGESDYKYQSPSLGIARVPRASSTY